MLLAGRRWESLNLREACDVVYVALIEPQMNGSMMSLGEMLQKWDDALLEAVPDRDSWGTSRAAEQGAAKAEEYWGQARKLDKPRPKRTPRVSVVDEDDVTLEPEAWARSTGVAAGLL